MEFYLYLANTASTIKTSLAIWLIFVLIGLCVLFIILMITNTVSNNNGDIKGFDYKTFSESFMSMIVKFKWLIFVPLLVYFVLPNTRTSYLMLATKISQYQSVNQDETWDKVSKVINRELDRYLKEE